MQQLFLQMAEQRSLSPAAFANGIVTSAIPELNNIALACGDRAELLRELIEVAEIKPKALVCEIIAATETGFRLLTSGLLEIKDEAAARQILLSVYLNPRVDFDHAQRLRASFVTQFDDTQKIEAAHLMVEVLKDHTVHEVSVARAEYLLMCFGTGLVEPFDKYLNIVPAESWAIRLHQAGEIERLIASDAITHEVKSDFIAARLEEIGKGYFAVRNSIESVYSNQTTSTAIKQVITSGCKILLDSTTSEADKLRISSAFVRILGVKSLHDLKDPILRQVTRTLSSVSLPQENIRELFWLDGGTNQEIQAILKYQQPLNFLERNLPPSLRVFGAWIARNEKWIPA